MSETSVTQVESIKARLEELDNEREDLLHQLARIEPASELRPFRLQDMHLLDHGAVAAEFNYGVENIWAHISRYPYQHDGEKFTVQDRAISLEFTMKPEISVMKGMTETAHSAFESLQPKVKSVLTTVSVKSKLPHFSTKGIRLRTSLDKGRILTARFHPEDNDNEYQQRLDFGDDV